MTAVTNYPVIFTKNDVEIIARETLYQGFFRCNATAFATVYLTGE